MYSLSLKYLKKNSIQNTITVLFILSVIFSFLDKTSINHRGNTGVPNNFQQT